MQISERASNSVKNIMQQDKLPIDMTTTLEPLSLLAYIKDSQMKLWDHAFNSYFRGHDAIKKSDDSVGFKETALVVRRVLFTYWIDSKIFIIYVHYIE